jgi:hypothetical protein
LDILLQFVFKKLTLASLFFVLGSANSHAQTIGEIELSMKYSDYISHVKRPDCERSTIFRCIKSDDEYYKVAVFDIDEKIRLYRESWYSNDLKAETIKSRYIEKYGAPSSIELSEDGERLNLVWCYKNKCHIMRRVTIFSGEYAKGCSSEFGPKCKAAVSHVDHSILNWGDYQDGKKDWVNKNSPDFKKIR